MTDDQMTNEDRRPPLGAAVYVTGDEAAALGAMLRKGAARAWRWLVENEGDWAALNRCLDAGDFIIVHPHRVYSEAARLQVRDDEELAEVQSRVALPRYSFTRYEETGRIIAHLVVEDDQQGMTHVALGYLEAHQAQQERAQPPRGQRRP